MAEPRSPETLEKIFSELPLNFVYQFMRCTVCRKQDPTIDAKLLRGASVTDIAKEYDLKIDAVRRHLENHLRKFSEGESLITMFRQVIRELDDAALSALAKNDHRALIDARRRKADALEFLLEQESQETQANVKNSSGKIDYAVLDGIVERVRKNYSPCPLCGQHTMPKPSGNLSGKPVN